MSEDIGPYFILMWEKATLDLLYGYASVCANIGNVRVVQLDTDMWHAHYQHGRLQWSMASASDVIYDSKDMAIAVAKQNCY